MGFVWLAVLGVAAFAGLWALGVARTLWSFVGAALMLGAAGYAWQGRPMLDAQPAKPAPVAAESFDAGQQELRDRLLGRFSADTAYLVAADAMTRAGDRDAAAAVVLGGVRALPRSFTLWTWLGTTIAARDGDRMSPPALFAFQQATRLAPEHPAPPFYQGMAYVRAGDFRVARGYWARAVRLSPEGTAYRRDIAMRLALLDRFLALQEAGAQR